MGFGIGFEHRPEVDIALQKKKKLLSLISREKKLFPLEQERIELYRQLIMKIYDTLPEEEQEAFAEDPIEFRSQHLLFRGLDHEKTRQLLRDGKMMPQEGQFAGTGVYFSDSPLGAASFMPPDGSLVVVERENAVYLDKEKVVSDITDRVFKKKIHDYIESLPENERTNAKYTATNKWDTAEPYSAARTWQIIALRQEQPLTAVKELLVPNLESQKVRSMNPNEEADKGELLEMFDEKK